MEEKHRNNIGALALGILILWANAEVRAQEGATNTAIDADTTAETELHPPHLRAAPPPLYPPGREDEGLHPTVILRITVTAEGEVTDVVVEHSAGLDFDAEAVRAVEGWTFEPATRGDMAISSRIRVAVHFEPVSAGVPHEGETHEPQTAPHVEPAPPSGNVPAEVAPATAVEDAKPLEKERPGFSTVAEVDREKLRAQDRGAGDFTIDRKILDAAPAVTANDLLRRAPGLYVANVEGDAAGGFFYLRGFNAEHGQDIELKLGDVPLNQPSNIHGQGYTYLDFIIPEVVRELRVIEGVYDPAQGDFAVAGTVAFDLGVEQRGIYAKSQFGSFRTFRQVAIFAPEGKDPDTFGAFQFRRSDGFGENRDGISGSAMFQVGFGREEWRFRLYGSFWGARYNSAGVLRADDIENGSVGFYDVYPYATARAQNGYNAGAMLGVHGESREKNGKNTSFDLWIQLLDFRIAQNFTGFLERSRVNPGWVGRGDLIEQRDRRLALGGNARHRMARFEPGKNASGSLEMGVSARVDLIDPQQQNLVEAPANQTWDQRIDANIVQSDIGLWVDLDWDFSKYFNVKAGARTDVLFFDVDDKLGNFVPDFRPEGFIPGFRRTAAGVFAGPRVAVAGKPTDWIDIIGAYGKGFRSPQAITLVDGEIAPFSEVRSVDAGVRFRLGPHEELKLTLTGYRTWLNRDVAFDAAEGRLENIGPTSRTGFVFYAVTNPLPWLVGSVSVTYVDAILEGPPPPTVENPTPPFQEGDLLPSFLHGSSDSTSAPVTTWWTLASTRSAGTSGSGTPSLARGRSRTPKPQPRSRYSICLRSSLGGSSKSASRSSTCLTINTRGTSSRSCPTGIPERSHRESQSATSAPAGHECCFSQSGFSYETPRLDRCDLCAIRELRTDRRHVRGDPVSSSGDCASDVCEGRMAGDPHSGHSRVRCDLLLRDRQRAAQPVRGRDPRVHRRRHVERTRPGGAIDRFALRNDRHGPHRLLRLRHRLVAHRAAPRSPGWRARGSCSRAFREPELRSRWSLGPVLG
jgi:TonB family protein